MRILTLFLFLLAAPALAQPLGGGGKAPVEVEASEQLEWLRDQNMYRATGDVMIKQGETTIRGDSAEAAYDPEKGSSALTIITVIGHVVITDPAHTIHADKAIYDATSENLTLLGDNLDLASADFTVTAHDNMQYNARDHVATAAGHAKIVSKAQNVTADTITAWLDPATGKLTKAAASGKAQIIDGVQKLRADTVTAWLAAGGATLERAEAVGHVVMSKTTEAETDIAQAQRASYDAVKKIVTLTGAVRITRGTDHMQGDIATIDMATGRSALAHAPDEKNSGGRVKAIFSAGGDKGAPAMQPAMPMIAPKKQFEPAYAVGTRLVDDK